MTGGKYYAGYLCSQTLNGHPARAYVSAKRIEPVIVDWLMTFDAEIEPRRDDSVGQLQRDRVLRDMNALEDELAALTRQLSKGIVPESAYLRARSQIEGDVEALRTAHRRLAAEDRATPAGGAVASLRDAWPRMSTAGKNKALRQMIDRITLADGGAAACIMTTWGDSSLVTF